MKLSCGKLASKYYKYWFGYNEHMKVIFEQNSKNSANYLLCWLAYNKIYGEKCMWKFLPELK